MSNQTYWALKQREWAAREQRSTRRSRRLNVPLRGPQRAVAAPAAPIPAEVLEEATAEIVEAQEPEYDSVPEADEPEDEPAEEPKPKKAKAG